MHQHVMDYFRKMNISPRELLEAEYLRIKRNEIPELSKERKELLNRVAQIDEKVAQLKTESSTKWKTCGAIFEDFKANHRDINTTDPEHIRQNRFWIKSKLEKKGIKTITEDEFIEHYQDKKGVENVA